MALVFIPASMRNLTGGLDRVTVEGSTLRQVINNLDAAHPGMKDRLCNGPQIKSEIAVAIDGEALEGGVLLEEVRENSEVHFLPSISGGQRPAL